MPLSKRKQNGKKVTKMKQKYEVEMTLKEPISELDKEILTLRINESALKLSRRMHLCSHMEEEMSVYRSLYCRKRFFKSENMRLLNEIFRHFISEVTLLAQECDSMKSILTERQHFSRNSNSLSALGAQLEANFLEYEKCHNGYTVLVKASSILEDKVFAVKNLHNRAKGDVLREFDAYLLKIENEVNLGAEDVIEGCHLFPWQASFQRSGASLDSSPLHTEHHHRKDSPSVFPFIVGDRERVLPKKKILEKETSQLHLHLENQNVLQQDKIRSMKSEMANLEEVVRSLEMHSHLLHTVNRAGYILKQQLSSS